MSSIDDWYWQDLPQTTSTNDDALALSHNPPAEKFVITAEKQVAGRGRRGRSWIGLDGNLFMSLAVQVPLKDLGQLIFAVSLSLAEVIEKLAPRGKVSLKWPNDVLLEGEKVSGILLEKGEGEYIIAGLGVNIKAAPEKVALLYHSTSLRAHEIEIERLDFLRLYLRRFDENMLLWHQEGFEPIRQNWLKKAQSLGQMIRVVNGEEEKNGIFLDVDNNGLLLLQIGDKVEKIYAGDVFYK